MRHYLYQAFDTKLNCWILHNFMEGSPEQVQYSCNALSIKKPETLVDKQDWILYCSGEVEFETGKITLYKQRELVFDYTQAFKKAFPEQKLEEVVQDVEESN